MTQPEPTPSGSHRTRFVISAVAIGLIVIATALGFMLTRQGQGASEPTGPAGTTSPTEPDETPAPARTSPPPIPGPAVSPRRAQTGPKAPYRPELEPAKPDQTVAGEDGLLVALTKIEHVEGRAVQPGEVSGPAVRVTITLTNRSRAALDSELISVNAYSGKDRTPAGTVLKPGALPFEGKIRVGQSSYAIYLFTISPSRQDHVTITVDYRNGAAVVVFSGDLR